MLINFSQSESACKFGNKCSFPHRKVEDQPNKKPKQSGDRSAVATVKDVRQLGCVLQDTEPPEYSSILRKGTKVLGPIRRVRFTRAASGEHPRNQRSIAESDTSQTSSPAQSPRYEIRG